MSDLSSRIRRITEDLHALQAEIISYSAQPASPEYSRVMDDLLDRNLINELRSAVDNIRHFLFAYMNSSSTADKGSVALRSLRMQRVTEMLRILRPSLDEVHLSSEPVAISFLEEVVNLANAAIERHPPTGKP